MVDKDCIGLPGFVGKLISWNIIVGVLSWRKVIFTGSFIFISIPKVPSTPLFFKCLLGFIVRKGMVWERYNGSVVAVFGYASVAAIVVVAAAAARDRTTRRATRT